MNSISFDKDVLQETVQENTENLKVAQLNLEDFNQRMNKEYDLICRFTDNNPRFFLKQDLRYPENTNTIASQINWLLMWKKEVNNKKYFKMFFSDLAREFEEIRKYDFLYMEKDNIYYRKVENFKKKYTDYAPLGFLTDADEVFIKEEIHKKFLKYLP